MMVCKKMRSFKVHNLWPIPVYQGNIPVKKEWKEKILNLEYERTHIKNSDISKDRYILDSMTDLKQEIDDCCETLGLIDTDQKMHLKYIITQTL